MGRVVVTNHLTLDGVLQGPGHPDEDRRGGFEHGGWQQAYADPVMESVLGQGMAREASLLLGRRTYEKFAAYWPHQEDNPITTLLNERQKYVASTTLTAPLPWVNSTLLPGDAVAAVATLKHRLSHDLVVLGSGQLIQSMMRRDLVDEYLLMIHPLVLGSGRRLFTDGGAFAALRLVDTKTTTTGVVIATYQPAEPEVASTSQGGTAR